MGQCAVETWILLLILVQIWFCPYFHCQSGNRHVEPTAHLNQGHATAQTTGIGGHMATRFIPTVERESIDLV